jgi:peptidoglycan hydrolase-like protein with peptidoglycan-binding domain
MPAGSGKFRLIIRKSISARLSPVRKRSQHIVEDEVEPETLGAGPVAILSGVLIVMMSTAILYNAILGQHGTAGISATAEQEAHVEIITAGAKKTAEPTTRISVVGKSRTKGGSLVAAVQSELAALGLFDGPSDGVAGYRTRRAIAEYQRRNGLPANGKADQELLDHIRFTTKLISASEYTNTIARDADQLRIRKIQAGLAALGYRPGQFDGHIGTQTSDAIRQFEADRGWPVTGEISDELIAELTDIGAFKEGEAR